MSRAHTHPCRFCKTPVDCPGELMPNYDGWPTVLCSERHRPGGVVEESLCDSCAAERAREEQA